MGIQKERFYDNQDFQDQLDAETIYNMLENEIAPLFYKRDVRGVPVGWVSMIQKSISEVAPEFTMNRMLRDYIEQFYDKLYTEHCACGKMNMRWLHGSHTGKDGYLMHGTRSK